MFKFRKINKKTQKQPIDYVPYRKIVADLIFKVLTEKIHVKDALLKFPEDINDESIQVAWHALCYLEADEDLRIKDIEYANEQNDYLEMIAFTMQAGDTLPQNITDAYKSYHTEALIPHSKKLKGIIDKLTRLVNVENTNQD